MNYFLQIEDADGKTRLVPIADIESIPVIAGDNIIVMDEHGNPVDVSLRPAGKDLVIDFKNGESVVLKDFYNIEEGAEPITISLNPKEPVDAGYEFNSQTGNLPNAKSFTLMRFSNTEYVNFVEQIDELGIARSAGSAAASSSGGGGGSGGNDNLGPDAIDDASVTDQNTTLIIDVLGNDSDPNPNDALIISGVDQPDKGSVTVNSLSQIVFDPGDDFDYLGAGESAIVTFNYSIFDGNGGTDTATVTLTVNGVDDVTDTAPDAAVTDENTPITIDVLANDSDPDANDVLTIDLVTPPAPGFGSVINNGTDLTFDPGSDFDYLSVGETATVTFTYTTNTGITETVTVTINGVNDAPVAFDDAETTDQDSIVNIDLIGGADSFLADWDPDGDALIISEINGVIAGGTITLPSGALVTVNANGTVDYNPNGAFDSLDSGESAIDTFVYTISDGSGGTATATATVTVNGVDDVTVTNPDTAITNENSPVLIDVLGNDSDPDDTLTVTSVDDSGLPGDASVTNNGGTNVTFNPGTAFNDLAAGESETVTFTYTTNTGATEDVTVTINGLNDGPDAIDDARTTDQDTAITIDVIDNDTDADLSDVLLITGVDTPARGSASINASNQIVFNPGNAFDDLGTGQSATVTFNYSISDGNGGTDTATITVTVNGVDDATVTNPDADVTDEATAVTIDVLANDSDADTNDNPLTIDLVGQPTDTDDGVVVNNGGDVTFTPGSNFDSLAVGESATTTFTYTTNTGATEDVTVTINGVNDAPTAVNDTDGVDEDATISVSAANGVIQGPGTDTDVDATDALTVVAVQNSSNLGALVGNPLAGVYGTLTLNTDGSYSYTADQDAADPIAAGETAIDVFTYTISDGNGGTDTATLTITITGTNDVPLPNPPGGTPGVDPGVYDDNDTIAEDELAPATGNVLANDVDLDTSDVLVVSEVNGVAGNVANAVSGTYGEITIDADGAYEYFLDNTDPTVQGLAVGETLTETFTYTADDQNGGTATATLTITITGTNDVPPSNPFGGTPGVDPGVYDDADSITEDAFPNTTDGNVLSNDVDPDGDTLTVVEVNGSSSNVGSQIVGSYGAVTINSNGSYSYVLDNSNPLVNGLDDTDTLTDSFTYTADDGNGGTATATITVTINGVDDVTVTNPDTAITNENSPVLIDVLGNDSDPDDTLTVMSVDVSGLPVGASVTNNGGTNVTFDPGTAFNALAAGESATTTFTYTTNTGATEDVTVTINGLNDGPDAIDDTETTDQNTLLIINALSNDTDPDTSDVLLIVGVDQPAKGSASINASNQIVFNPGNAFDDLGTGQSATVTFNYSISDGNGGTDTATITVTVNGVDDATVTAPDTAVTNENTPVVIDVLANDSDADTNDNPLTIDLVGQPTDTDDGVVVNNGGDVTFTPGSNFDSLAVGESATTTFTYTTNTGATEDVTVTINGVNDAPTAVNDTDGVDEDATISVSAANGVIQGPGTDTDVDATDALTVVAVQNSSNLGALVGNPLAGVYGTLTLNTDGSYSYTADQDAADPIAAGETAIDVFTYTISDGNGGTDTATLTITITGTNDVPLPNPPGGTPGVDPGVYDDNDTIAEDELAPATGNVLANDVDLDTSDVLVVSEVNGVAGNVANAVSGTYGEITIDADGAYEYFLDNTDPTVQGLAVGETLTETFTYTADDQNGGTATATLTITITGTNDVPPSNPFGGTPGVDPGVYDDADSITEDAFPNTTDGNVLSNDVDPDGDTLTVVEVNGSSSNVGSQIVGSYGAVTINSNGSYSYVLDNSNPLVNGLDDTDTLTDSFTYTADDGNGGTATATITVTINGVDDVTVTNPDTAITNENSPVLIDVLGNDSDPDDTLTVMSVDVSGLPVGASVTNNGGTNVTFDPGTAFNALAAGESATTTFTYTTNTGATEDVTVTINGLNDGPDAIDDTETTDQNTLLIINALSNDTDPDTSDVLLIVGVDQPAKGSASINASNQIVFNPGNAFDDLGTGQSATVTFNYSISDGNGGTDTATITVTVNGVDDATVTAPDTAVTNENTPVVIDVLANDSDADISDTPLEITAVSPLPSGQGSVTFISGGADVTFDPGTDFDYLAAGESATVSFTYTTDTGATEDVTVTINGVNDGPDAVNDSRTTDQNSVVNIDLLTNDTDIDGDSLSVIVINGTPVAPNSTVTLPSGAIVTLFANGTVGYDPNGQFDSLDAGESAADSFTYVISDGNGGSDVATVNLTINGIDDATVAAPDAATTDEETSVIIDVLANDVDPDTADNPLTISSGTQPLKGSVSYNGNNLTFDPGGAFQDLGAGESETVTFTYTTTTGITETVTVTVNGVDDPTVTQPDTATTTEDTPVTINVLANDSDPDTADNPLTIGSFTQPAKGSITSTGTSIVFDPGSAFQNLATGESETVTFTYSTDTGATETVTVTVMGDDDDPIAANDADSTDQNTLVNINLLGNDNDPDGDALTVASINGITGGGTITLASGALLTLLANGTVNYNPNGQFDHLDAGESATDTFTYVVSDGGGGTDTATVTVTINGLEDALEAANDVATTFQSTPIFINTLVNDSDPDTNDNPLTVIGVSTPALGLATFTPSGVAFNPNGDFNYLNAGQSATVTFNYTVENANGDTDTASVTVTVLGSNDPTITNPDTAITNEDTPVGINVLANDSDPDANQNPLTITSSTTPSLGLVTSNGTSLTFNPDGDFESLSVGATATVTFTYTTNTGVIEDVTVTITGVNDAPVANDDIVVSTTDILPVSINVVSNDTDIDGTVVASSVDLNPGTPGIQTSLTVAGEGTWTTNGAGLVTFTPTAGITDQPTPITYEITDNNGGTSQAVIDLKYSAADVWFGNDESGSVNNADFNQSRVLISGAADQMTFATGSIGFNAALFTWSASNEQQMELALNSNEASFVASSSLYGRNFSGSTDIGAGIAFGTQQILASVTARQQANHPRADVPQVMVILTDATPSQILNDTSLLADAQLAKNAGIILVFVAIQEAQQDPLAVDRLEAAASLDQNGQPFIITAANYSDIGPATIADLLNEIREAAAAGLLPPVVIDLDGDGTEFLDIDNGILFDVDGDGDLEQVAWAGNDDAVLVYDENGNNDVDGVNEISFARYSDNPNATDLEGLRHFDTNNDLILDANDAEFDSFKLWQDRDGDGLVGDGEMMTLTEAGIHSLELISDNSPYYTAGGDVKVNGTAVVNFEDGTTGTAADAEFGYRELIEAHDSIEIMTSDGDVLNLSSGSGNLPSSEVVTPDLVEPSNVGPSDTAGSDLSSGAAPATNMEDDMATAGATMA